MFIPREGYKKGIFDNNKIVEVWEEKLPKAAPKTRIRVKTEQMLQGRKQKKSRLQELNNSRKNISFNINRSKDNADRSRESVNRSGERNNKRLS